MVYAMDTLGYAKRLRDAGIPQQQAEAHAEAARDFVMAELVTRNDLQAVRSDFQVLRTELEAVKTDFQAALRNAVQLLEAKIDAGDSRLEAKIDTLTLRLTVRLGGLLAAGIAILAGIIKLG